MIDSIQKLAQSDSQFIAYQKTKGKNNSPEIVFLGGFMSDMSGTKATAFEAHCRQRGYPFLRFDYMGHGCSSGLFTEGTIGLWKENVLQVIDRLTSGPLVLIGSSMGGWLMLLAALERPSRIAGLMGIASAPDFTELLIWNQLSQLEKKQCRANNILYLKSEYNEQPYPITYQLISEGRHHLLLHHTISVTCPVRLMHGMKDHDVPAALSQQLVERLVSADVSLKLVADGDHRLSHPHHMTLLCQELDALIDHLSHKSV